MKTTDIVNHLVIIEGKLDSLNNNIVIIQGYFHILLVVLGFLFISLIIYRILCRFLYQGR